MNAKTSANFNNGNNSLKGEEILWEFGSISLKRILPKNLKPQKALKRRPR
jgi:hypothetical protein